MPAEPSDRVITPPPPAPEPATPRALWPTFMRRTLAEETLREVAEALPPRPTY